MGFFPTSLKKNELTQKSAVRVYFRYMRTTFMFEEKEETLNASNTDQNIDLESLAKKGTQTCYGSGVYYYSESLQIYKNSDLQVSVPFTIFPATLWFEGDHNSLFFSHHQWQFIRRHREAALGIVVL